MPSLYSLNVMMLSAPVVDYDAARAETAALFDGKIGEVKGYISKLQKAEHAAESALDMYAFQHIIL